MTEVSRHPELAESSRDRLFIGGEWIAPTGSGRLSIVYPATEEAVGEVPRTEPADADAAVAAARAAFDGGPWPQLSAAERAGYLLELRAALERRIEAIALTITLETGSPLSYSQRMQRASLDLLDYYAAAAARVDEVREQAGRGARVRILREPAGVAALILPWNGPFGAMLTKLAPALLAGCTVVVKPAPETALDAYQVAEAAAEVGLPGGVVNIVHGGAEVGGRLAAHPGVDKVSVTGSVRTGQAVLAAAAEGIKRVTLELGGKSPLIVLPSAPLDAACSGAVRAGLMNAGQVCIAWSRVFAPADRYEEVAGAIAERAAARRLLDPMDPRSQMGPLSTRAQLEKVERYVAIAREEGARVLTGGRRPPDRERGWWYEPTVLADVENGMTVAREEVFGPVIAVIPYDDVEDAVAMANDSEFGLSGGVWGGDEDEAFAVARRLRTGTVSVNTFAIEDTSPFGGYKRSGIGREWGIEGLDAYLELKTVALPAASGED